LSFTQTFYRIGAGFSKAGDTSLCWGIFCR
jgi:hypothetical protein